MSIVVYSELHMPVCDFCGMHLPAEYSESEARSAMRRAGWEKQDIPAETVCASKQKLFAPSEEPGMAAVDLCALCVREGRRYQDRPPPLFPPGGYRRFG